MARYEELKKELGATVFYGKQIGEKLRTRPRRARRPRSEQEAVRSRLRSGGAEKQQKADDANSDQEHRSRWM
jgi:hypothetical protein